MQRGLCSPAMPASIYLCIESWLHFESFVFFQRMKLSSRKARQEGRGGALRMAPHFPNARASSPRSGRSSSPGSGGRRKAATSFRKLPKVCFCPLIVFWRMRVEHPAPDKSMHCIQLLLKFLSLLSYFLPLMIQRKTVSGQLKCNTLSYKHNIRLLEKSVNPQLRIEDY